jgi:hypothetical protein
MEHISDGFTTDIQLSRLEVLEMSDPHCWWRLLYRAAHVYKILSFIATSIRGRCYPPPYARSLWIPCGSRNLTNFSAIARTYMTWSSWCHHCLVRGYHFECLPEHVAAPGGMGALSGRIFPTAARDRPLLLYRTRQLFVPGQSLLPQLAHLEILEVDQCLLHGEVKRMRGADSYELSAVLPAQLRCLYVAHVFAWSYLQDQLHDLAAHKRSGRFRNLAVVQVDPSEELPEGDFTFVRSYTEGAGVRVSVGVNVKTALR